MLRLFIGFVLLTLPLTAQDTPAASGAPTQPSVRFSFDWPQGIPWEKYSIEVESDGTAHFDGTPHADDTDRDTDPVVQTFTMSPHNRQTVFELAQKLNYFRADLDSHIKHVAQTGKKTLQYQSPQIQGSATFNYSQNPDVQHLLKLFTGIATTLDFGRKLAFQYRFDKLGLHQTLLGLQELRTNEQAAELPLIAPILQKIAGDPNLMNMDRATAQHLLQSIGKPVDTVPAPGHS